MKKLLSTCRVLIILGIAILVATLFFRYPIVPNGAIAQKKNFDVWLGKHKDRMSSLIYEYREYSAECYADSQHIKTHPVSLGPDGQVYAVYIIEWKWTHRDPTLPGFMEFLERKYK